MDETNNNANDAIISINSRHCNGETVLPGDILFTSEETYAFAKSNQQLLLGPGIFKDNDDCAIIVKPGVLRCRSPATFWIDSYCRRYIPVSGDLVLGVVVQKLSESWRVDIGTAEILQIAYTCFEGATKRNRPNINIGDVLYARLTVASKYMEPELTCVDDEGRAKGLGLIGKGGFMFDAPIHLVRKVLNPEFKLIKVVGKSIPFTITIGMNGKIWIKAHSTAETIAIANAICMAEYIDNSNINVVVEKILDALKGF